jgi:glycosyltransferase involved in cell wall biosynthesis
MKGSHESATEKRDPMRTSVIMAAYNRGKDIGPSIDAILCQSDDELELIVVNDGSSDDTEKYILEYKDPRIVYIKKDNGGQASARNFGLKYARGEYIAYCDHDDIYHKDHVKTLADFLDFNQAVDAVYSNANFIVFGRFDRVTDFSSPKKAPDKDLYFVPMPSTMMHRKTALEKTGLWDEHEIIRMGGEDWDLWLRFKDRLKIAHLDKVLTDYCLHGQNMNTGKTRRKAIVMTRAYVFTKRFRERMKTLGFVKALIESAPEYARIFG